jgi:hypothetical protein
MTGSHRHDLLVKQLGPLAEVSEWETVLRVAADDHSAVRKHTRTGRPFGDDAFVTSLENVLGREYPRAALRDKVRVPADRRALPLFKFSANPSEFGGEDFCRQGEEVCAAASTEPSPHSQHFRKFARRSD